MNNYDLLLKNIDIDWYDYLITDNLDNIFNYLNQIDKKKLTPKFENIFRAFKYFKPNQTKIIIIGQDPYPNEGIADGLCFSCNIKQKSVINIIKCLEETVEFKCSNKNSFNLESWAKQGILLLNTYLSNEVGKKMAHKDIWNDYIIKVLDKFLNNYSNDFKPIIFCWGAEAQNVFHNLSIDSQKKSIALFWGHPSTISKLNKEDNPKSFQYCDHFKNANNILITNKLKPINWNL